ncbi:Gnat family [Mycena sanguinolenta]|uniref:Gnat family n=1 Tax=Mycena sanguinolenta TaxID=230812 RepID=A0A8H7DE22_9AGAR|nr:Gnat family [Mycena sanguinolenta]
MAGLEYNSTTGEPFLRLPAPFTNFIITPPRLSDAAPSVEIMTQPSVAKWMGPSILLEYNVDKATAWLTKLKAETDAATEELRATAQTRGPVSACPLRHLREVQTDGTEIFLGDVGIWRSSWPEVLDAEERARLVTENNARPAGDPEIAWHVSYYLAPSHQGRGLTTVAVKTLIKEFGIPWMRTKYLRSGVFQGNPASLRVLQKCGFEIVDTLVNHVEIGGEKTTVYLVELRVPDSMPL